MATPAVEKFSGYHSHVCPGCGVKFVHGDDKAGDQVAHTCPGCGQTLPLSGWPPGWVKASVFMANGQEKTIAAPVPQNDFMVQYGPVLLVAGIAIAAAVLVYMAMPWIMEHLGEED